LFLIVYRKWGKSVTNFSTCVFVSNSILRILLLFSLTSFFQVSYKGTFTIFKIWPRPINLHCNIISHFTIFSIQIFSLYTFLLKVITSHYAKLYLSVPQLDAMIQKFNGHEGRTPLGINQLSVRYSDCWWLLFPIFKALRSLLSALCSLLSTLRSPLHSFVCCTDVYVKTSHPGYTLQVKILPRKHSVTLLSYIL